MKEEKKLEYIGEGQTLTDLERNNRLVEENNKLAGKNNKILQQLIFLFAILILYLFWITWYVIRNNVLNNIVAAL